MGKTKEPYRELDVLGGKRGEITSVFGYYEEQKWEDVKLVKRLTDGLEWDWNRWKVTRVPKAQ